MTQDRMHGLTKKQLLTRAKARGIRGYDTMTKEQLIKALLRVAKTPGAHCRDCQGGGLCEAQPWQSDQRQGQWQTPWRCQSQGEARHAPAGRRGPQYD